MMNKLTLDNMVTDPTGATPEKHGGPLPWRLRADDREGLSGLVWSVGPHGCANPRMYRTKREAMKAAR